MLCYVRTSQLLVVLVSKGLSSLALGGKMRDPGNEVGIEAMRSAFWSAESEALHSAEHCGPLKTRLYHSAKHCGPLKARLKTMAKSQIFLPFFYI